MSNALGKALGGGMGGKKGPGAKSNPASCTGKTTYRSSLSKSTKRRSS